MPTLNEIFERAYEREKFNCSGFVRHAAAALKIRLEGQQADDQLDFMEREWTRLKNGMHAAEMASQHFFVVAGLKSTDYDPPRSNGHVVVIQPLAPVRRPVTPKSLYRGLYPPAWGGDIGKRYMSQGNLSVGEIFNRKVRDRVRYYMPPAFGPHTPGYR